MVKMNKLSQAFVRTILGMIVGCFLAGIFLVLPMVVIERFLGNKAAVAYPLVVIFIFELWKEMTKEKK